MAHSTKHFDFAPPNAQPPKAPEFAVASTTPVQVFEFGGGLPSAPTQPRTSLSEVSNSEASEEHSYRARLIEELKASGELFTRAEVDAEIDAARQELREELQSLHQQEMEDQSSRHEEAMSTLFDELQRWREAITHQSTEFLLRLCETLTMHLVQQSLIEHPERYVTAVTPAIKELMGFGRPRLYVPSFALGAVSDRMHELKGLHPDHLEVEVLADDELDVGDFRFEADGGRIDADMEKRLNHLVETCRQRALATFAEWDEAHQEEEPDT